MNNSSPNLTDFLPQFKLIGQSLKKRFFRKPNVAEVIEQYETLCQELQRDDQKEFAGICLLEEAKCHENLQNHTLQANCLMRSAKYLLEVRDEYSWFDIEDKCVPLNSKMCSTADGHLQMGIQALTQVLTPYNKLGNKGLVLLLKMKIGSILLKNQHYGEALKYFKGALEIGKENFTLADQLVIVEYIIKCKVKMSELESASKVVAEYEEKLKKAGLDIVPTELYKSYLQKFEITKVCLLLLIGCDAADMVSFIWRSQPQKESESKDNEAKSDLEEVKIAAELNSERDTVILHLKSLVLAVQHGSVNEIHVTHNHLSPYLDETQQDLFRILIQLQS